MPLLFDYAPPRVWALICLLVALFYVVRWPASRAGNERRGLRYIVLRWFHALVWLVLAASVGLHAVEDERVRSLAKGLAFLALMLYAVFAVAVLAPRRRAG